MSAAKRRIKRKIKQLVRMDRTHNELYLRNNKPSPRANPYWASCIIPLGDAIARRRADVWALLPRHPIGTQILVENYLKRKGEKS